MQTPEPDSLTHSSFFVYRGCRSSISQRDSFSFGFNETPYMLDVINDLAKLVLINGKGHGIADFERFDRVIQIKEEVAFSERKMTDLNLGYALMIRVSECKYFIASVYRSSILIEETEAYLEEEKKVNESEKDSENRHLVTEFQLQEREYTYLEWPPLNHFYIKKKNLIFLTLDNQGGLRIQYVKEGKTEIIEKGELFQSATFSLDGRYICAINWQNDLYKIDSQSLETVTKRRLGGILDPERVRISHIRQVTPWTWAFGCIEEETIKRAFLVLIDGNIWDENENVRANIFEMPISKFFSPDQLVIFRSLYIKERELLLFGHTGTEKILVLNFEFDGRIREIGGLKLDYPDLRGFALVREEKPFAGQKKDEDIFYQGKKIRVPRPPQIFILDSAGYVHMFRFYDTRYAVAKLSMFIRPLSMREFSRRKRGLKEKLLNSEKRLRSKSQPKSQIISSAHTQKKNRSKSQYSFSEAKILSEEKQKIIEDLKKNVAEKKSLESQSQNPFKTVDNPFTTIKKTEETPDNPFTSVKRTEEKGSSSLFSQDQANSLFKKVDNPFLTVQKTQEISEKKSTSSLFSATQTGFENSLFGPSTKTNSLFQKSQTNEFKSNSLFSSTKKAGSGIDSANIFVFNSSEKNSSKGLYHI